MMQFSEQDQQFMQRALDLAKQAADHGEVPVGAVLVQGSALIAEAYNQSITLCDPSAHAEMLALRQGALSLKNYRLPNCTLYVTLEPCAMCAGAIVHARLKRVVYATTDPRTGACGSVMNLLEHPALNHHPVCETGLYAEAAAKILQQFFKARR